MPCETGPVAILIINVEGTFLHLVLRSLRVLRKLVFLGEMVRCLDYVICDTAAEELVNGQTVEDLEVHERHQIGLHVLVRADLGVVVD